MSILTVITLSPIPAPPAGEEKDFVRLQEMQRANIC